MPKFCQPLIEAIHKSQQRESKQVKGRMLLAEIKPVFIYHFYLYVRQIRIVVLEL